MRRRCVWIVLSLLTACGEDASDEPSRFPVGDPDPELAGSWSGTIDGDFGRGTLSFVLEADGTLGADGGSTALGMRDCPLRYADWGVIDAQFTLTGPNCDGTVVTLTAEASPIRMQGSWRGEPSGNRGTFDVRSE